jgi:hypothetical protein
MAENVRALPFFLFSAIHVSRRERSGLNLEPELRSSPLFLPAPLREEGANARTIPPNLDIQDSDLSRERPGAVLLPAGNSFDLPLIVAARQRIDEVAAHTAAIVAEGRYRPDPADKPTLGTLPNERDPVAELRQRKRERFEGDNPVAPVQSDFVSGEFELPVAGGKRGAR